MRAVDRSAILVVPKQPFLDWLRSVDDNNAELTLNDIRSEPAIYLIKECVDDLAFLDEVRRIFPVIFEQQLEAWWTEPSDWPALLTFDTFRDWFDCSFHSEIFDTCQLPLEKMWFKA
jgi:hypothetical protein